MQKYRRYVCRKCWSSRQRKYTISKPGWREKLKEKNAKYRNKLTPEQKKRLADKSYDSWLRRKYGITLADKDKLMVQQGGLCAICRKHDPRGKGRFHVDHCHRTGRVRGLLCQACNMLIGLAAESVDTLKSAAKYLSKHRTRADHTREARAADGGKKV